MLAIAGLKHVRSPCFLPKQGETRLLGLYQTEIS